MTNTNQAMPTMRIHRGSSLEEIAEAYMELYDWLEEFRYGTSQDSVGTVLSGVNGIIAGTQVLADVQISGRGSLNAEQDAQAGNITSTAEGSSSSTVLAASVSPAYASSTSSGSGSKTTGSVVVTPSGGVGPYTYAWAKKSGEDIPPNSPSAATTTFTGTVSPSEFKSAVYTCTVTDSTGGTPLQAKTDVSVTIGDISSGIGAL